MGSYESFLRYLYDTERDAGTGTSSGRSFPQPFGRPRCQRRVPSRGNPRVTPISERSTPVRIPINSTIVAVSVIAITSAPRLSAQSLAQRIAKVPDGVARVQFASRP